MTVMTAGGGSKLVVVREATSLCCLGVFSFLLAFQSKKKTNEMDKHSP